MRKELRSVSVRAATDVVDCVFWDPAPSKLKSHERGEIAVRPALPPAQHRRPFRRALHLARNFDTDFECVHANVRTDRDQELCGIVRQGIDCSGHDFSDGATPPRVHGGDVPSPGMREQHGDTIGSARRDREPFVARHQRIALTVGDELGRVVGRDFPNLGPVNLALLEKSAARDTEALREPQAVLAHRRVVIAEVETQVQCVVGRRAHAARTQRKRVAESVPIQKGGMKLAHALSSSTARLHRLSARAKSAVVQVRAGSWLMHRFPSAQWTNAFRIVLNHDRAYRDAGKSWTFGSVALIIRSDGNHGPERFAGIILDVHEGQCRGARFVEGERDPDDAEFVIVGAYLRWKEVIEGTLDPIKAMMEGKLRLARGHLPTIVRYVEPSRTLVAAARKVPTWFAE